MLVPFTKFLLKSPLFRTGSLDCLQRHRVHAQKNLNRQCEHQLLHEGQAWATALQAKQFQTDRGESNSPENYNVCVWQFMQLSLVLLSDLFYLHLFLGIQSFLGDSNKQRQKGILGDIRDRKEYKGIIEIERNIRG